MGCPFALDEIIYLGDSGCLTRILITIAVVPVSHHDLIPGLHLVVDLLSSPGRILRSTMSQNWLDAPLEEAYLVMCY